MKIDTEYLVYTDAKGRDPDSHSPTLKGYNQILWSKKLPCGSVFELQTGKPNTYLYHRSNILRKRFLLRKLKDSEICVVRLVRISYIHQIM